MIGLNKAMFAAGGALAATLGVRILRSADAKKVYTYGTAALLREKDYIMAGITDVKADCEDILADAKELNVAYAEARNRVIENHAKRAAASAEAVTES